MSSRLLNLEKSTGSYEGSVHELKYYPCFWPVRFQQNAQ